MSFPAINVPLTEADFEPDDKELTHFTGPTIQIMGCLFHTFAFAVEMRNGMHRALDAECDDKYSALQGFYEGVYETISLRGKDCVLIIHPFTD
jgi:hypothetical protein